MRLERRGEFSFRLNTVRLLFSVLVANYSDLAWPTAQTSNGLAPVGSSYHNNDIRPSACDG